MEEWELEFEWLQLRHQIKDQFNKKDLPDLRAMLFLIGIQELGKLKAEFTKEEKQDLMHIAVCSLLEGEGYYSFKGRDEDGWPHWKTEKAFTTKGVTEQEKILKENIINYFRLQNLTTDTYEN